MIKTWLAASRKVYNETVDYLKQPDTKANWMAIKLWLLKQQPIWIQDVPFQIKSIAIKDACQAVKKAKTDSKKTGKPQRVKFRSIKNPVQSIYIPKSAIKGSGLYPTVLGNLHYTEPLPKDLMDSRLLVRNGSYYLCLSHRTPTSRSENQARVVSLDPGVRTFQTFFSESECGKIGEHAIGRIQRLCSHLDDLISRKSKATSAKKRRMGKAANNMRVKIRNIVDELQWKTIRFLCENYDVIICPKFETSKMVIKKSRKIRSKSTRQMLTFSHSTFRDRLHFKAKELGKIVIESNEAYTSKTASWTGEIRNIGGAKSITSQGITLDRDINGARGIFLRALVDTPTRKILLQNLCIS